MRKWLEIGTNLIVIAMAGLLVFTFLHYKLAPWQRAQPPTQLQVGVTLAPIRGAHLAPTGDTLVLAIRKGCHFCEDSMPFYKSLLALRSEGKIRIPIVAVLPDSTSVAAKLLSSHGITMSMAPNVDLSAIGVLGTPTMILVDSKRKVRQVWVGEQSPVVETGVIAELESLGTSGSGTATHDLASAGS